MTDRFKKVLVGFILFLVLAISLTLAHSASLKNKNQDDFVLYAYFSKTDGLNIGAPVRLAGIAVGHVFSLDLVDGFSVRVALSFDKKLDIPSDTSAIIETDGILGSKHIELVPGGDEENLLSGEDISYTQDVLLLDELLDKVLIYMRHKKNVSPDVDVADIPTLEVSEIDDSVDSVSKEVEE